MEVFWVIVWGLIAGIIIGPLARLVLPGKQDISLVMTILIGAVGAIGGGLLYELLGGGETSGIDWIRLIVQVGVAALLVILYGSVAKSRAT